MNHVDQTVSDRDLQAAIVACGGDAAAAQAAAAAVGIWSAAVGTEVEIDLRAAAGAVLERLHECGDARRAADAALALAALVQAAASGARMPQDTAGVAVAAVLDAVGIDGGQVAAAVDLLDRRRAAGAVH